MSLFSKHLERAKPPLALAVVDEGLGEMVATEVGPERRGDVDFGVGELPEEEVAQAHFAAGADEEVGVGIVAGIEMMIENLLVDLRAVEVAQLDFADDRVDRLDDLDAAAVAERE